MNSNLLIYSSKLALLCLMFGGLVSFSVTPAKANNLTILLKQVNSQSDRSQTSTANIDNEFAKDKNKPILLSQSMEQVTSVSQLSDVQPTD